MTNFQRQMYIEVVKVEEMSERAFLMAWDDYFALDVDQLFYDWILE